jgi:hypothetical protein
VEAAAAQRPDVEPEIDLGKRTHRDRHGRDIVTN